MPGMFDMPVRGSHSATDFPSASQGAGGGAFKFSLPTPGGGDATLSFSAGAPREQPSKGASGGGGGVFRPFTFSAAPSTGGAASRNDDTTSMTDEDAPDEDEESPFDFANDEPGAKDDFQIGGTPDMSQPGAASVDSKPSEKSQMPNIQFELPSMDVAAASSAMQEDDMPAGEDAFSHMSGKTGHTARDDANAVGEDEGKCSQESDTSHATSRSAESAYTCETRSVVSAAPGKISPNTDNGDDRASVRARDDEKTLRGGDEAAVDLAQLARLSEEHEHHAENVKSSIDKFVTVQNAMRAKLLTAGQEFSAISENAGSLQVNLAQTLSDLLEMKLQLSIRKVANHKLLSKVQHALEDADAREKRANEQAQQHDIDSEEGQLGENKQPREKNPAEQQGEKDTPMEDAQLLATTVPVAA